MPCIEVLSEIVDESAPKESQPKITNKMFRTTVAHFLTGRQMVELIREYQLYEWAELAKQLIRDRTFAVSDKQAEDCRWIKFWNQELNHLNELKISAPQLSYPDRSYKFHNECIELRIQYLRPSYICLRTKDESRLAKFEKSTLLDDILSEGMAEKDKSSKDAEMTIAKMEIPENQIQFIVSVFGKRPEESDTNFTSCLA